MEPLSLVRIPEDLLKKAPTVKTGIDVICTGARSNTEINTWEKYGFSQFPDCSIEKGRHLCREMILKLEDGNWGSYIGSFAKRDLRAYLLLTQSIFDYSANAGSLLPISLEDIKCAMFGYTSNIEMRCEELIQTLRSHCRDDGIRNI